jgi:hypothetical protein
MIEFALLIHAVCGQVQSVVVGSPGFLPNRADSNPFSGAQGTGLLVMYAYRPHGSISGSPWISLYGTHSRFLTILNLPQKYGNEKNPTRQHGGE